MGVHDRHNIWPCFVDAAVDESFNRRRAPITNRFSIQTEFYDIGTFDYFRSGEHVGHEELLRVPRMPNTDVAISIHDVFVGEDPISDHEFVKSIIQFDHHVSSSARRGMLLLSSDALSVFPFLGGIHATPHFHGCLYALPLAERNFASSARNERRSVAEPQWRQRKHKICSARSDQQEQRPESARRMAPACGGGRTDSQFWRGRQSRSSDRTWSATSAVQLYVGAAHRQGHRCHRFFDCR